MSYYDFNLLILLPSGSAEEAATIRDHAPRVEWSISRWSNSKHKRETRNSSHPFDSNTSSWARWRASWESITIPEGAEAPDPSDKYLFDIVNQAPSSRITIFGHGDAQSTIVGGRSPETLAKLLIEGCGLTAVTKISLLACYAGGNLDEDGPKIEADSSYAKQFHGQLAIAVENKPVMTNVNARTRSIHTTVDGVREAQVGKQGEKNWVRRPANSKYVFYWIDGEYGMEQGWQVAT